MDGIPRGGAGAAPLPGGGCVMASVAEDDSRDISMISDRSQYHASL